MTEGPATSTATVLFCDVVGSTERRAALGEVEADRFFRDLEQALRSTVESHGGRTVKGGGDGIMAVFGAASDAVNASVALHGQAARRASDLRLRVGVAAGDVSWEDGDCFGLPVVVAARLEAACEPGTVLVSVVVRYLAGDRASVVYEPVGPLELKGIPEPVEAFSLTWQMETSREAMGEAIEIRFPSSLPPAGRQPFVGRAAEFRRATALWDDVRGGGRAVLLVGGEAGAGKTRLITELARSVHEQDGVVLAGGCDSELSLPYQPWAKALGELVEQLPDRLVDAWREDLRRLQSLVPAVERRGVAGPVGHRDPEGERYAMFLATAALLRSAASIRPVLLVLDDLHWAGQQTLALLRFLTGTEPVDRLLIAATFRDTGDEITDPLATALADFHRDERAERIKLEGIDAAAVAELLSAAGLSGDLDERALLVRERTGGNPFLVGELTRQISGGADLDAVPDSVREVVLRRVRRLSGEARATANLIAVGGHVAFPILQAATGFDVANLGEALVELVQSGLIIELPETVPSYQFAHALIRDAIDTALPHVSRAGIHHSLALALEEIHEADRRPVLAQLARHFAAAAPVAGWEKAADYGGRAAGQARRTAAYDEAIGVVELLLDVVPFGSREHAQLLVDGADLLMRKGRHPQAVAWADRAFLAAEAADDIELQAAAAIEMDRAALLRNEPSPHAEGRLDAVLRRSGEMDDLLAIRVRASLGRSQLLMGRSEGSSTIADALGLARASADPATLAHAVEVALSAESEPTRLLALADELAVLTSVTGNVYQSFWGESLRIHALIGLGCLAEAVAAIAQMVERVNRLQVASFEWEEQLYLSLVDLVMGRFEEAEQAAEEANTSTNPRFVGIDAAGTYGLQMFLIRREQGRLGEVRPVLELLARSGDIGGIWETGLLAAYTELGMLDEARLLLDHLLGTGLGGVPRDAMWPLVISFLADSALALDRSDLAPELLVEFRSFAGRVLQGGFAAAIGPADTWRAVLAEWVGDIGQADEALAAAVDLAESSGSPVWQAHTALAAAWIAGQRGDERMMTTHLDRAGTLVERHGLRRVATHRASFLAGLDHGRDDPADGMPTDEQYPDGLSGREVEVLRLLGRGLTNRAIGEALFISGNTVANHVRNILQKTGTANRTEAVSYAVRRGLLEAP